MNSYTNYSREELLEIIDKLKKENEKLAVELSALKESMSASHSSRRFKERYATQILDSLPDMLTVISHSGVLVELVSSEETNHVGTPSEEFIGKNMSKIIPAEATRNVMDNLNTVLATHKGSIAHHDLWVDGVLHHYENRIFPLDNENVLCMCRDVTEAINSQHELKLANLKMQMAEDMASLSHWYYYKDIEKFEAPGILPLILKTSNKNVRCSIEEYLKYVHPDDAKLLRSVFLNCGSYDEFIEHRVNIDGKIHYLHTRLICSYRSEEGLVYEGYVQDMTYMTERLHELEMVKYAVNNAVEEIFSCSMDGTLEFVNNQFICHHNLDKNPSEYKLYDLKCSISDKASWNKLIEKIRKKDGTIKYITPPLDLENGSKATYEVDVYIINKYGEDKVWFFSRDVSARMQGEEKVRKLNYIMDAILNNIPVYLFVKDPANEFRYVYWNRAFEKYSHIPASKALGRTDYEIFPCKEDADKFRRDDLVLLQSKERREWLETYVTATGETRIVTTSKALVPSENNLPLIIGISWDITETKNIERELIAAKMKAEQSDRLKTAFLANMSHEIRTPLNAIVGFSKLLVNAEDLREKEQYSDIIDRNSELLLQLINDILDISKIEAGSLEFTNLPFDLGDLCRYLYNTYKSRTNQGVTLVFDSKGMHLPVAGDQTRISQVITNLITNACKFTEKGTIHFGFYIEQDQIHFYVKDTGKGIEKEKYEVIFDRFIKLDNFVQGTGLGLPICKMIIEKMNGKIWVESEKGKGSAFHFLIPYNKVTNEIVKEEKKEKDSPCPSQLEKNMKTVLIAEDVESNYLLLKALIGKKYTLVRAHDGKEAVELFQTTQPDMILMDIKMPNMDGLEATRVIRGFSKEIPIVALTAFAFESDREDALQAGCNDLLTKPVSIPALNQAFEKYLKE